MGDLLNGEFVELKLPEREWELRVRGVMLLQKEGTKYKKKH